MGERKKKLLHDPLASPEEAKSTLEEKPEEDPEKYRRATFMIKEALLDKLKNYCYTERITQREALEKALSALLDGVKDDELIERPKR